MSIHLTRLKASGKGHTRDGWARVELCSIRVSLHIHTHSCVRWGVKDEPLSPSLSFRYMMMTSDRRQNISSSSSLGSVGTLFSPCVNLHYWPKERTGAEKEGENKRKEWREEEREKAKGTYEKKTKGPSKLHRRSHLVSLFISAQRKAQAWLDSEKREKEEAKVPCKTGHQLKSSDTPVQCIPQFSLFVHCMTAHWVREKGQQWGWVTFHKQPARLMAWPSDWIGDQ